MAKFIILLVALFAIAYAEIPSESVPAIGAKGVPANVGTKFPQGCCVIATAHNQLVQKLLSCLIRKKIGALLTIPWFNGCSNFQNAVDNVLQHSGSGTPNAMRRIKIEVENLKTCAIFSKKCPRYTKSAAEEVSHPEDKKVVETYGLERRCESKDVVVPANLPGITTGAERHNESLFVAVKYLMALLQAFGGTNVKDFIKCAKEVLKDVVKGLKVGVADADLKNGLAGVLKGIGH